MKLNLEFVRKICSECAISHIWRIDCRVEYSIRI